jgi:hypothetical protein
VGNATLVGKCATPATIGSSGTLASKRYSAHASTRNVILKNENFCEERPTHGVGVSKGRGPSPELVDPVGDVVRFVVLPFHRKGDHADDGSGSRRERFARGGRWRYLRRFRSGIQR